MCVCPLSTYVISGSKGHRHGNLVGRVVARHIEREGIDTGPLGGSDLSSPVIQAK